MCLTPLPVQGGDSGSPAAVLQFEDGNFINVGNSEALNPREQITLEAWIKPEQDNRTILWRGHSGTGSERNAYALMINNGQIRLRFGGSQTYAGEIEMGKWTHVAATFDGGEIKIYQDGKLVGTDSGDDTLRQNAHDTVIGIREFEGDTSHGWTGGIAEVRIWDVARSETEIRENLGRRLAGGPVFREFTNDADQSIRARLLWPRSRGLVELENDDRERLLVDPDAFSQSDRDHIRSWARDYLGAHREALQVTDEGLAGYWPLDEGSGGVAYDRTPNGNHGGTGDLAWVDPSGLEIDSGDSGTISPILIASGAHEDPSDSVRLLLDMLQAPAESTVVLEEVFRLLAKAGDDAKRRLAGDPESVETLVRVIRDQDLSIEFRTKALELHPSPADMAAMFLDSLKGRDDSERLDAIRFILAGGDAFVASLAADAEAVASLRNDARPHGPDPALRAKAWRALELLDLELPAGAGDWPMWQYDASRSGDTPVELAEDLFLQWVRELPAPRRAWTEQWDNRGKLDFDVSFAPVVMGDLIFVPSSSTDSVTAYRIDDGEEQWRFHANGPVRLAPAAWEGRVYFVADDGHLYCVDAATGELVWKFRGGPSDHHLLGNERIINFWPARGGPVVSNGTVYFTAGIWPLHGVFIYALNAESGEIEWVNDTTSSDYVNLPHGGASGYGGLAPQGYLAIGGDQLIVAGGRTTPAYLNLETGAFEEGNFRPSKGAGNYAVHAGGMGFERNRMLSRRLESLEDEIEGEVFYQLAAHDRLFVTTTGGKVYCFGPQVVQPRRHEFAPAPLQPRGNVWSAMVAELGDQAADQGYALLLGAGSGDLMREIVLQTDLHLTVVEGDPDKVLALRRELAAAGVHGDRAAVIESSPALFSVQPYLFSLVVSEDLAAAGLAPGADVMEQVLNRLRPYSGLAWLGVAPDQQADYMAAAEEAAVDQVSLQIHGNGLTAGRSGPLTGAGTWTHQYADPGNTMTSRDQLVRLPVGVLWFGGPNNHNILPRHSGGPRPHVIDGRQVYLGVETIGARCVYTGRQLWVKEFPGIGHPFTNLDLEERWREGREVYMTNIPGATYIGSPFVTLADSIYLRHEGRIHRLEPATGETADVFSIPGTPASRQDDEMPDWGHISVQGDYLITTAEPHMFEDQELGWTESYSGTSSKRLVVMDRHSGEVLWQREARIGFRHNAIVSAEDTVFIIDGLSENAVEQLGRRGRVPDEASEIHALDLSNGNERWSSDSRAFGTYLLYSGGQDILIEGGSVDLRRPLGDEPRNITARRGSDGDILWEGGDFTLPGAVRGDMLIPGRPGRALSILTGERWERVQPHTGERSSWSFRRVYGCNTLSASEHLLLYRSGYAGYFDLEHDTGTGNIAGFRSGCTSNMLAADGVLNALDYTRTCTCSYAHQTSLALIHMPDNSNLEFWTRYDGASPDPANHGINFGAPGRRVDVSGSGRVWHDESGTHRRHPSAITAQDGCLDWVAASAREYEDEGSITIRDLPEAAYTVRLHFAEHRSEVGPGQRVFDVVIDGETVLSDFDIVASTGGSFRGMAESATVQARGTMRIELKSADGSQFGPIISGVEIMPVDPDTLAATR